MKRIVLEDIKLNRKKEEPILKEKVEPFIPRVVGNDLVRQESKIDQYFRNEKERRLERTPQIKLKPKILHKTTVFFLIIVFLIGIIYWGGNIFQKTNIIINSKHQAVNYRDKQFTAKKSLDNNSVNFTIMIYPDKKMKKIILTDSESVSLRAKGSVTLYNEFTETPQKIISGTFLSDEDGRAYQLNTATTIPGYKIENKKIVPGEIVVEISSFLPGDAYNGSPKSFYINAFKGTTKYNKIYGKLKNSFLGGASGLIYKMNDNDKNNIDYSSLKDDLFKKVDASVPPGYILYPEAMTFSYKINDEIFSKNPEAEIEIDEVLAVVLLNEDSLEKYIIKNSLPLVSPNELKEIIVLGMKDLKFNFVNKDQLIDKDLESIDFTLTGDLDINWKPDQKALQTKLLGLNKNDVLSIFKQDSGISSASVKIFPPWFKYLPKDLSKIKIEIK